MRNIGSARGRVVALAGALALCGGGLIELALRFAVPATPALPDAATPLLGAAFFIASVPVAYVRMGRESQTMAFRDLPMVVGLALFSPVQYALAHLVGALLHEVLLGRRGLKLAFNCALTLTEAGLAVAVYRLACAGASPLGPRGVAATYLTVVVVDLVSSLAVAAAIRLHTGRTGTATSMLAHGLLVGTAISSVGLLALVLWSHYPPALLVLLLLLLLLGGSYRRSLRLSEGNERLEDLYSFTRESGRAVADDRVSHTMLLQTRRLMQAERAELHLLGRSGLPCVSLYLDETGYGQASHAVDWWAPAVDGSSVHHRAGAGQPGPQDALATPLRQGTEVVGVLAVVQRVGTASSFGAAEERLFDALAGTAGISLHNACLLQQLRGDAVLREHEARHDPLTGLLNRRGIGEAIDRACAEEPHTLLVLSLNRFQEIADSLGHTVAEDLLRAVAGRLQGAVPRALVGHLGGEEFAVLGALGHGEGLARGVLAALEEPFSLHALNLPVTATVGSAYAPQDGTGAGVLLRRAGVARRRADDDRTPYARFHLSDEQAASASFALVSDLRDALGTEQLQVHYQPKLDLRTGAVRSVEALVRWTSPTRGAVAPDNFIPLSESSGLVDQLTDEVLATALRDLAGWRAQGLLDTVAVNLSARTLLAPRLARNLSHALELAGLPPQALTLELTETAVVTDETRAAVVLGELAEMGLTLSMDDFGTGYSSLSYLRRLPLHEVKIDKSFVLHMTCDPRDLAVVRSTVVLAHDLGLRVVGEGVETPESLERLRALGCDTAQGYGVCRPVSAPDLTRWLSRHMAGAGQPAPAVRLPRPRGSAAAVQS